MASSTARATALLGGLLLAVVTLFPSLASAGSPPDTSGILSSSPAIRAEAVSGPRIVPIPASINFGGVEIGQTATRPLVLANTGDQTVTVLSVTASNARFSCTFTGPVVLAPGTQHPTQASYQPTSPVLDTGLLTFVTDVAGSVQAPLSGTGTTGPNLGDGRVLIAPTGEHGGDQFGNAVSAAGDLNGDGFDDVIVGAWSSDVNGGDAGRAYVFLGGSNPSPVPALFLQQGTFGDNFGTSAAGAGDVNGDGYPDVVVGSWGGDTSALDAGSAYVYLGGPSMDQVPDLTLHGEPVVSGRFGVSVEGAGDVNGDGYGDFVVGASGADRAYVYFGGPGLNASPDWILSGTPTDLFGWSVSGAGDVNGDGFDDVIVGAHGNDAGGSSAGRAYVYFGGSSPNTTADWIFTGAGAGARLGIDVKSAGDVNGDGFGDVIVGSDFFGTLITGRAYVFFGGATPDVTPDLTFTDGSRFLGASVCSAGDVNADGFSDLLVSNWLHSAVRPNAGRAYVHLGGPSADAVADFILTGEEADDRLGISVSSAGDANGDGYDDIILGAYFNDAAGLEAGRAYVVSLRDPSDPVVSAPESVTGSTGAPLTIPVAVTDPEGRGIVSLAVSPDLSGTTFDVSPTKTSGTLAWTPSSSQAGTYSVTFTATNSTGGKGSARTTILVQAGNTPPSLSVPASVTAGEGVLIGFQIQASDPDGDAVVLGVQNRPVGSVFVDQGNNTGTFNWTPSFNEAGVYAITFTGRDARGANAIPKQVSITVDNVNRAPNAAAGGPYAGVVNVPVAFAGAGSSDPDGDALHYLWSFGDGSSGTGSSAAHTYGAGGSYAVTLRVDDGTLEGVANTVATIQDVFQARAFLEGGNKTVKLNSGKATACVQLEPVDGAYANSSVVTASIVMISPGTGSVSQISAAVDKAAFGMDRDRNGIDELTACFRKEDLRLLFGNLSGGRHLVGVTLEGDLTSGGRFHTTLEMEVVASGGGPSASVSPNPLNPTGTLTFHTARPGPVSVTVFDPAGRMVRTLRRDAFVPAGYHDVMLDGIGEDGVRLASGVYFFRVETVEGVVGGRFVVMK